MIKVFSSKLVDQKTWYRYPVIGRQHFGNVCHIDKSNITCWSIPLCRKSVCLLMFWHLLFQWQSTKEETAGGVNFGKLLVSVTKLNLSDFEQWIFLFCGVNLWPYCMVAKGRSLMLYPGIGKHELRCWQSGAMMLLRMTHRTKRIIHVDPQILSWPPQGPQRRENTKVRDT